MQLKAEPDTAGKVVRCPGCNTKLQIPQLPQPAADQAVPPPDAADDHFGDHHETSEPQLQQQAEEQSAPERQGWIESDPTNANMWLALAIGLVTTGAFLGVLLAFAPPADLPSTKYNLMQYLANVWKGHLPVNGLNTLFFFWAIAILYLKLEKLRHQRRALLLDVLPADLGGEINAQTVGSFIDHIYGLPHRLRDSLMVNRIRKGLELFEGKQNVADAVTLMSAQSDIDSARIGTSYVPVKAFLWAIPIMGFVGTVLGLSHALLSLDFKNLEDVKAVIGVLKGVINGLGGAFDATLVGLVFAMLLNFPMNALAKAEDDCLNDIDAFCNEVLIPRLNDGGFVASGDTSGMMDALVKAVAGAQQEFLGDLNALSAKIVEQAHNLDKRAAAHQERVDTEFAKSLTKMRDDFTGAVTDAVRSSTDYTRALASGIQSLNNLLSELGGKQILIHQVKKKGWFSRD
ncbi:MAG: MotA/TolQ/ExbB proton channel family protein [Verrucomicrobiaceae bacterium]|nr:MotA/TolQ/ExbB proton channel family protein [Verrucomicrobiaceae bacterium]